MTEPLQPFLAAETVVLRAPTQAWSASDGRMGTAVIHGIYHSDVRVVSALDFTVDGMPGEPIGTSSAGASDVSFHGLLRQLDGTGADPDVRYVLRRIAGTRGVVDTLRLSSRRPEPLPCVLRITLAADVSTMDAVKAGGARDGAASIRPAVVVDGSGATWASASASARLDAPGASIAADADTLTLEWQLAIPPRGSVTVEWSLEATDRLAVVAGVEELADWTLDTLPALATADPRLRRWCEVALSDLAALRLTTTAVPGEVFLAAGAPWFFTLFGRDSIWAARMMLGVDVSLAGSTLRVLAGLQGRAEVPDIAEQPGKIMHELRRAAAIEPSLGFALPPLYYGTVDATPLWICLLVDAWRAGLPGEEVVALLPALRAALAWMRDYGDADGDGLLEYIDSTGRGLANQGWKDSGDSVQWRDGSLARGPIALSEVQAYAFEAATGAADLLAAHGEDASEWRAWAARLRARFQAAFWIDPVGEPDATGELAKAGPYVAIALDADKRPVDTVTSNMGHLLGTGILDPDQVATIARHLTSPAMNSGFGLRTMSSDSAGFWPLGYHGGSVWTHDTAIAITGLLNEGADDAAHALLDGLLSAAEHLGYRMPELHSGDSAADVPAPLPYPASCRPQAWSAAAALAIAAALQQP